MAKPKFAGGTIAYYPDRIEILGRAITEASNRGNFWNVLQLLRQTNGDGRFKAFSGNRLAQCFKGHRASQNTVSSCVGDLRQRIADVLAEAGMEAGVTDVILSGGPGYRFKEWMKVEDCGAAVAGTCGDIAGTCPRAKTPMSPHR